MYLTLKSRRLAGVLLTMAAALLAGVMVSISVYYAAGRRPAQPDLVPQQSEPHSVIAPRTAIVMFLCTGLDPDPEHDCRMVKAGPFPNPETCQSLARANEAPKLHYFCKAVEVRCGEERC